MSLKASDIRPFGRIAIGPKFNRKSVSAWDPSPGIKEWGTVKEHRLVAIVDDENAVCHK
jgi:hypothetical protein